VSSGVYCLAIARIRIRTPLLEGLH
jgi:hypothetical protein